MAETAGVSVMHVDKGTAYTTRMIGVPAELSSVVIYDEKSLEPVLRSLPPYYGFNGNEELRLVGKTTNEIDTVYIVRQYINGIETSADLRLRVDNTSARLIRVDGWLYGGVGVELKSRVSEAAAIDLVVEQIEKRPALMANRSESNSTAQNLKNKHAHQVVPLYRPFGEERQLSLWWGVGIAVEIDTPERHLDGEEPYEWFYVDPEGKVSPWREGNTRAGPTMVCNGAGTSGIRCQQGGITVINAAGQCLNSSLCGSASSPYRIAYDTAAKVEAMWNDLYPGQNFIGDNNLTYGGDLEIKINGSALGTASGWYEAHIYGPNLNRKAGIIIDGGAPNLDEVVAHEMGHGWNALKNWVFPSHGG